MRAKFIIYGIRLGFFFIAFFIGYRVGYKRGYNEGLTIGYDALKSIELLVDSLKTTTNMHQ